MNADALSRRPYSDLDNQGSDSVHVYSNDASPLNASATATRMSPLDVSKVLCWTKNTYRLNLHMGLLHM